MRVFISDHKNRWFQTSKSVDLNRGKKIMTMQIINNKQIRQTDGSIQDEILRLLWNQKVLRSIDVDDISVSVENGQVCLSGHVPKNDNYEYIEKLARSIPGVVAVHNHLVNDHDLKNQVALALGKDERTSSFNIPVFSYYGWVGLGGRVPNHDIQCASEEIAASVESVRGVILVPNIKGENPSPVCCMVQPRIGDIVHRAEVNEAKVYQVVINPQNRLVTHVIVRVNQSVNSFQISCDHLLPAKDIRFHARRRGV